MSVKIFLYLWWQASFDYSNFSTTLRNIMFFSQTSRCAKLHALKRPGGPRSSSAWSKKCSRTAEIKLCDHRRACRFFSGDCKGVPTSDPMLANQASNLETKEWKGYRPTNCFNTVWAQAKSRLKSLLQSFDLILLNQSKKQMYWFSRRQATEESLGPPPGPRLTSACSLLTYPSCRILFKGSLEETSAVRKVK